MYKDGNRKTVTEGPKTGTKRKQQRSSYITGLKAKTEAKTAAAPSYNRPKSPPKPLKLLLNQ